MLSDGNEDVEEDDRFLDVERSAVVVVVVVVVVLVVMAVDLLRGNGFVSPESGTAGAACIGRWREREREREGGVSDSARTWLRRQVP